MGVGLVRDHPAHPGTGQVEHVQQSRVLTSLTGGDYHRAQIPDRVDRHMRLGRPAATGVPQPVIGRLNPRILVVRFSPLLGPRQRAYEPARSCHPRPRQGLPPPATRRSRAGPRPRYRPWPTCRTGATTSTKARTRPEHPATATLFATANRSPRSSTDDHSKAAHPSGPTGAATARPGPTSLH